MTTKILDAEWTADPTQPGRIAVGDVLTIGIGLKDWRSPLYDSDAMRLVSEATALVLAAPTMAKALRRIWNAHHGQDGSEEIEQALLETEAILAGAGVPLP